MSLQFNADGTFKILQVTDFHMTWLGSLFVRDFLYDLAKRERPDLFVLTGDNVTDQVGTPALRRTRVCKAIHHVMRIFDKIYRDFGTPVTMVPGNHDAEAHCITRQEQFDVYAEHKSFIGVADPQADAGTRSLHGPHYGTHNLLIHDKSGAKPVFNLWMFDSGDVAADFVRGDGLGPDEDCVQKPQVDWFKAKTPRWAACRPWRSSTSLCRKFLIS